MIKICIVEDHTLFREGVKSLLGKIPDFDIVAEYSNGKEFIDDIDNIRPDVVLMDVEMPLMNGVDAARSFKALRPQNHVIALSMYSDQQYYFEMIKVGISGFVLKEASVNELEKAIRDVYAGMGFFSPALLQKAVLHTPNAEEKLRAAELSKFTERELEILNLVCQGCTNNEMSEKLFLSPKTIESHKSKLMSKSGAKNNAGLIIYAIKNKLVSI